MVRNFLKNKSNFEKVVKKFENFKNCGNFTEILKFRSNF